ncbi:Uncharacterised protein [uncultured archaeon]|nr:Uncharacterised protein [uncultured archaeon]
MIEPGSWLFFAVAALAGLIVKFVDQIEDAKLFDRRKRHILKYPLAIVYGALIGFAISFSTFASLWLAALFAQFVTGKIDRPAHLAGFLAALLFAFFSGIGEFHMLDFFVLIAFAAADEISMFQVFGSEMRIWLKFAALLFGIFGRWDYFIAIMAFDAAYYAAGKAIPAGWYRKTERGY